MRILAVVVLVTAVGLAAGVGLRYALDSQPTEKVLASRPPAPPPPPKEVTLVAVGDVLLDKWPGRLMAKEGVDYPFLGTAAITRAADISICNLECCIAQSGHPMDKEFTFRARPETLAGLVNAGYDIVTLANNHALDYGRAAFCETLANLAKHGLDYVGGGTSIARAHEPKLLQRQTMRIAFLAYDALAKESMYPGEGIAGIAHADETLMRRSVGKARQGADAVVVYFHWGTERAYTSNPQQRRLARIAAEAGADLVLGSHPHVVQDIDEYTPPGARRPVPIVYSLGNFVWGQRSSVKQHGAIFRCTLTPDGVTDYQLLPVEITRCQPRLRPASPPAKGSSSQGSKSADS